MRRFVYTLLIFTLLIGAAESLAKKDNSYNKLPRYLDIRYTETVNAGNNLYPTREGIQIDKSVTEGKARILNGNGIIIDRVSQKTGYNQSENWIAIDRNNPDKICASANDMGYWSPGGWRMAAYYTTDGGTTWNESSTPSIRDLPEMEDRNGGGYAIFDPALAYDAEGNLYYGYNAAISHYGEDESHGSGGVFMNKSTDGGATWSETYIVEIEDTKSKNADFHDKVLIAADFNEDSPYANRVYATWMYFPTSTTKPRGVVYSYSDDGEDWSSRKYIAGAQGNNYGRQSPIPVIGPDGLLYVVFRAVQYNNPRTEAHVQKSTNGGATWAFTSPKIAQTVFTCGGSNGVRQALLDKQEMRVSSFPALGVDQRNGNVYVVQTGKDDQENYGVWFTKSVDEAENWSKSKRIDDNALNNDMFFPAIDVDPKTGMIAVLYYSSQNDPNNEGVDAYLAISSDEGATWRNLRITPETWYLNSSNSVFNSGGETGNFYWGDYTSVVVHEGIIRANFYMPADPSNSNFFSVNTYVATIKDIPGAVENLKYTSNPNNPTEITLTWQDPTSTLLGNPIGAFKVAIWRGSEEIAEVDPGVQSYMDNGVGDGEEFVYTVKVRNSIGVESDPKSISGIAGGSPVPMPCMLDNVMPQADGFTIDVQMPATHIDGSELNDFEKLEIYLDDELHTTISDGINVGEINNIKITKDPETFSLVSAFVVGKRGDTETKSEISNKVLAYSGNPLSELNEDFESTELTPHFTMGLVKESGWEKTDVVAAGGSYSISDSPGEDYDAEEFNSLYFAPVEIDQSKTTLSFDHIALIHKNDGDYGALEVSKDYGKTWEYVQWFDINRSEGFVKEDIASSAWFSEHMDLSAYAGETVMLRFTLFSDKIFEDDGWYIDNLAIDDMAVSVYDNKLSDLLNLQIRPNPVRDNAELVINSPVASNAKISVYDAIGNEVMSINKNFVEMRNDQVSFSTDALVNGFYYVRVSLDGFSKTTPMVIQR
jgi:hypothetical protein